MTQNLQQEISIPELEKLLKNQSAIKIEPRAIPGSLVGTLLTIELPDSVGDIDKSRKYDIIEQIAFATASVNDSITDPRDKFSRIAQNASARGSIVYNILLDITPGQTAERLQSSDFWHVLKFEKEVIGRDRPSLNRGRWIAWDSTPTNERPLQVLEASALGKLRGSRENSPKGNDKAPEQSNTSKILRFLNGATVNLFQFAGEVVGKTGKIIVQLMNNKTGGGDIDPTELAKQLLEKSGISQDHIDDPTKLRVPGLYNFGLNNIPNVDSLKEAIEKSGAVKSVDITMRNGHQVKQDVGSLRKTLIDNKNFELEEMKTLHGDSFIRTKITAENQDKIEELKVLLNQNNVRYGEVFSKSLNSMTLRIYKPDLESIGINVDVDKVQPKEMEARDLAKIWIKDALKWKKGENGSYVYAYLDNVKPEKREQLYAVLDEVGIKFGVDSVRDRYRLILGLDDIKNLRKTNKDAFDLLVEVGMVTPGRAVGSPTSNGALHEKTIEVKV